MVGATVASPWGGRAAGWRAGADEDGVEGQPRVGKREGGMVERTAYMGSSSRSKRWMGTAWDVRTRI